MTTPTKTGNGVLQLGGLSIKELVKRVIQEVQDDNCLGQAAQLAYYFLFALFPFLLFLTTLLGFVPIPNLMDKIIDLLAGVMPREAISLVQENIRNLVMNQRGGLLSFGILAALWTASSAITAITDTLNRAYDVQEGRPFWKVRLVAILLTVGLSIFVLVSMTLLLFGPQIGGAIAARVGLGQAFETGWNILRWPVIVLLLIMAMAVVYYFAPDVKQKWKWITPGSAFAVIATILASLGFSYYVNHFGSYNATYGSIGAVIVLLTWMYLSGFFVLLGGEINAEIEHASAAGKAPGEKAPGDAFGAAEAGRRTARANDAEPSVRRHRPNRRASQTALLTQRSAQTKTAGERFPIRRQTAVPRSTGVAVWIKRHPWFALATASAVGFLVTTRLMPPARRRPAQAPDATAPMGESPSSPR